MNQPIVICIASCILFLVSPSGFAQLEINISDEVKEQAEAAADLVFAERDRTEREELEKRQLMQGLLENFNSNEKKFDYLELLPSQVDEIEKLKLEYAEALKSIEDESSNDVDLPRSEWLEISKQNSQQIYELKGEFIVKLSEVLLEHQLRMAKSFNLGDVRFPKSLIESELSSVLELSEEQKLRIREKSDLVARKVLDFTKSIRNETYSSFASELTPKQIKKLKEFYGEKGLERYFGTRQFHEIFVDNLFESSKIEGIKSLDFPERAILSTPVEINGKNK